MTALIKTVKLAFAYLRYYKKQTLSLFFGVIMSVALMTGVGSLLYSGRTADMERTREIYGDAHYLFDMNEGDFTELQDLLYKGSSSASDSKGLFQKKGFTVEKAGILSVKKVIEDPYPITFAYADSGYMEMFHRNLLDGAYPQNPGETALSERTIRNLDMEKSIGSAVTLDGDTYTLCGILSDQWDETSQNMKAFINADMESEEGSSYLYVKFEENGDVLSQAKAFSDYFHFNIRKIERVSDLNSYVGGDASPSVFGILQTALSLPEGRLAYFWGTMNQSFRLTEKLVLTILGLFAAFVIFSLFQVSVRKRTSQYSTLQVLGMDERHTFCLLLSELYMILLAGYPAGAVLGSLAAYLFYSRMGEMFVSQNIGITQGGLHTATVRDVAAQIEVTPGEFHASVNIMIGSAFFLMFLMLFVSLFLIRRMRKFSWSQMLVHNTHTRKRSRKILSLRCQNMTGILSRKFLFERKGTFFGIIISLSLGGVLFLGTTFVVENTRIHNALTFKADDGLASDIQIYEDSHDLSDVIPSDTPGSLDSIDGIASVNPVRYTLGEIPLENGVFKWTSYYPEISPEEGFEQDAGIMERYHGIITQQSEKDYRLKTNVYGYSEQMLEELKDYLLEGDIDSQSMLHENTIILKTLMDGQGNYDGIGLKPGDTIRLKVPKDTSVPQESLQFEGPDNWYQEKDFQIAAIVSRSLGKTDNYIGDATNTAGIIMTNQQMFDNFGIDGYDNISITLQEGTDHDRTADEIRAAVSGTPNCLVKDYTRLIEQQNRYLQQKMFFFYGIALILLLISIFHILNSMQYLVASRRHEFGILRAMGITDSGFRKILLKEGLCYGVCSGIFMMILYMFVHKLLYYALQHVFLYLHSNANLPLLPMFAIIMLNIFICAMAMLRAGREVLNGNMIDEIAQV